MRQAAGILCVALVMMSAACAWSHDGGSCRGGEMSAWSGIAAASEAIGRVMSTVVSCGDVEEAGGIRRFALRAVSCVFQTVRVTASGVPLPRATASVAADALMRLQRDGSAGSAGAADSERTR